MSITGETTHSKLIGYALWIFGFTGAHRFYFGKPVSGTIWFFTGGLFMVGWIIDIFLIPGMARESERRFVNGNYNFSVAWLLHTFSGIFGAHRFYLGKWGTGLLYLCTGGLFLIGYYYDFLTLNSRVSDKNAEGKPAWWSRFTSESSTQRIEG